MTSPKELRSRLRALRTLVEQEAFGHRKAKLLEVKAYLDACETLFTSLLYSENHRATEVEEFKGGMRTRVNGVARE